MSNTTYTVSSKPYILSDNQIQSNMRDVLIALLPAAAAGVYYLRFRALWIILITVLTCICTEALWFKLTGGKMKIWDLSAAVTGLILALNMPIGVPLWVPVAGGIFAILFVKQFFGGIGQNFMNPALAARAFLLASWAGAMSKTAVDAASKASESVDAASSATQAVSTGFWNLLIGPTGGYIGEVCVLALLIGGAYLIIRKVISFRVPASFLGTAFILSWALDGQGLFTGEPVRSILSGGLMLGAFFMATDHSTSPSTNVGQYIIGIGCGILTTIFRVYGHNGEGFVYAILIMNLFVPFIEKYTALHKLGEVA